MPKAIYNAWKLSEYRPLFHALPVLIVGAGAVGTHLMEFFAKMGLSPDAIDFDTFTLENAAKHSCLIRTPDDAGRNKAQCAAQRVQPLLEEGCSSNGIDGDLCLLGPEAFAGYRYVVAAVDNYDAKLLLPDRQGLYPVNICRRQGDGQGGRQRLHGALRHIPGRHENVGADCLGKAAIGLSEHPQRLEVSLPHLVGNNFVKGIGNQDEPPALRQQRDVPQQPVVQRISGCFRRDPAVSDLMLIKIDGGGEPEHTVEIELHKIVCPRPILRLLIAVGEHIRRNIQHIYVIRKTGVPGQRTNAPVRLQLPAGKAKGGRPHIHGLPHTGLGNDQAAHACVCA